MEEVYWHVIVAAAAQRCREGEGGLLACYSSSSCSEVQGGGGRFIGML